MTSTEASAEALIAAAEDTHGSTIRIAPALMIGEEDLDWGPAQLRAVLGV